MLLRLPDPYSFELSTERFRLSGIDLANCLHDGVLYRMVGAREVRVAPVLGGVDVEPLDDDTRPSVEKLLGLEHDLAAFSAWARSDPVLGPIAAKLAGLRPPSCPTPSRAS